MADYLNEVVLIDLVDMAVYYMDHLDSMALNMDQQVVENMHEVKEASRHVQLEENGHNKVLHEYMKNLKMNH